MHQNLFNYCSNIQFLTLAKNIPNCTFAALMFGLMSKGAVFFDVIDLHGWKYVFNLSSVDTSLSLISVHHIF